VRRGETKEQSYRRCWAEWQEVEQQLVGLDAPPVYHVTATTTVQYDPPRPTEEGAPFPAQLSPTEFRRIVMMETLPQLVAEVENPEQFVKSLVVHQQDGKPSETVATELAAQYQAKEGLAKAGQRAMKTAERFKQKVEHFVRWVGPAFPIASVTSPTLLDYHGKLCEEIATGKRTAGGAKDQLAAVVHFVRRAYSPRESLPKLPKVLEAGTASLRFEDAGEGEKRRDSANWIDDLGTLATILKASPERLRLWLYLMMNCGFQQTDVSELTQNEVDWHKGRITDYKRRKGRRRKNVPKVTYPLWPETFRLLKKYRAVQLVPNRDGSPRALLNEKGTRLLGEQTQTDNISSSYLRVTDGKLKLKGRKKKPLAALRKTSSTLLQHSVSRSAHAKNFTSIVSYFLGQAPSNVAKMHYTPEDTTLLAEGMRWLGEQYRKAGVLF
jgi:integrase